MTEMLSAFRATLPPLAHSAHKGLAGRIGVVGGSLEYTGAPYFAAISAMKAGADLGHVFCPEAAAEVIKGYSPELIVHPLLSASSESAGAIDSWLPRLHALVVGPGLGRDPGIFCTVKSIIGAARLNEKEIVIDADGLFLVTSEPAIVAGYSKAILTPNEVEFQRLYEKMIGHRLSGDDKAEETRLLAEKMGVVILRKGRVDTISDGSRVIQCTEEGSPRRCGGQGDLLSGTVGLFSYWAQLKKDKLAVSYPDLPPLMLACYGGCFLVKKCAELAFSKHCRSLLAGHMVEEIGTVYQTILEPELQRVND